MRQALLLAFLALFLSFPSSGAAQERPQSNSERLDYEVSWGYAEVGKMTVRHGCPRKGYVPAALTAGTVGSIEQVHTLDIRLDSFLDVVGRPLEGWTWVKENGKDRTYKTRFTQESGAARVTKEFEKKETELKLKFRGTTHDLLSWWYALRREDLKDGMAFQYFVWDGWKLVRVTATVGGIERVWTPHGTYDARRVELVRVRLHHKGSKAYTEKHRVERIGIVWFAQGKGNIPVALDLDAPVGVAKARLTRRASTSCGTRQ